MTIDEMRDREAIRALVTRLTIHGDRARFADLAACFTIAGTLRWSTGEGRGRADIAATLGTSTANPAIRFVRHHLTTIHLEFGADGTSARGRIYFFVISNAGADHAGIYVDRYVRHGGEWLIEARDVRIDWQAPTSLYPQQVTR